MSGIHPNREDGKDEGPEHRPNATGALVAIGLFTALIAELACLVLAARFVDEQMTARMFSAYVALFGLIVFAVLIQRGFTRSRPKPSIAQKLLYSTYLLAGFAILALINCGPYYVFFNAARHVATGS